MTDRELMQMALDALELVTDLTTHDDELYEAIDAIRARLTQPEQEPVAVDNDKVICPSCCHQFRAIPVNVQQLMIDAGFRPPFTAPPQREWQGLTDEEIKNHWLIAMQSVEGTVLPIPEFARAIEAKLKEKNG